MPNRDAIHAQSKHERWPIATPYMPNRNKFLFILLFLSFYVYLYMAIYVSLFVYIFTYVKEV